MAASNFSDFSSLASSDQRQPLQDNALQVASEESPSSEKNKTFGLSAPEASSVALVEEVVDQNQAVNQLQKNLTHATTSLNQGVDGLQQLVAALTHQSNSGLGVANTQTEIASSPQSEASLPSITNAITQTDTKILGGSPAEALGQVYQTVSSARELRQEKDSQTSNVAAQEGAATTNGIAQIYAADVTELGGSGASAASDFHKG